MIDFPEKETEILNYLFGGRYDEEVPWLTGKFQIAVKADTWREGDASMATKSLIQAVMYSGSKDYLSGWSLTQEKDGDGVMWNKLMILGFALDEKAAA